MSWQQFKTIGQKLHADLAAQHSPAHVRAILKILEGERLKEECRMQNAEIGIPSDAHTPLYQRIYYVVCGEDPREVRKAMAIVDALLTRQAMGTAAATAADKLYAALRGEFAPGPLRMILTAAARATESRSRRGEEADQPRYLTQGRKDAENQ